ncbi:MAG: endonuclease/exonuclease/phosphatase family protein [Bacteroidales bacterium]
MHIIGKLFDGLLLSVNIILLVLFTTSAFSDHVSPLKSVYLSYMGILFPFFLIGVLMFLVYWIIRMKWYALIGVVVLLICWEPVTRYVPYHVYSQKTGNPTIKLLTYNTCGLGQNNSMKNGNAVLDFINREDPDIVCLQEYTFYNRPDGLTEKKIRKKLSQYPYYHYNAASNSYKSGLAIFSKYPIKRTQAINYESLYNNSCLYELEVLGKRVTVINNHLESNQLSKEDKEFYNEMIRHFDSNKIDEIRTTLIHKLGKAYRIRAVQADTLRQIINRQTNPVIVCGDFNDTPISYCYQTIRGDLKDAFRESGFGPGITYHENKFWFRIDHILHSDSFRSSNAKVHHVNYSDHYPVSVTFSLVDLVSN